MILIMWPLKIEHPCQFTLGLLLAMIEKAPITLPSEKKEAIKKQYDEYLKDKKITCAKVEEALVFFGKEIWPYRKAWQEMYEKYGRVLEEKYFEENLPKELHDKYFSCKKEGEGSCLREYRMCGKMETCFTPEEKFMLDETVIAALEKAKAEVDKLVLGEKKNEYDEIFAKRSDEQKIMAARVEELKNMADKNPKWQAEILEKVKTIEEGWSVVERDLTLGEIEKILEFYKGALENPEAY